MMLLKNNLNTNLDEPTYSSRLTDQLSQIKSGRVSYTRSSCTAIVSCAQGTGKHKITHVNWARVEI